MKTPTAKYLEKAALLSREEAEALFSRMSRRLERRLEEHKLLPVEALAIQLQVEDERLREWRKKATRGKTAGR